MKNCCTPFKLALVAGVLSLTVSWAYSAVKQQPLTQSLRIQRGSPQAHFTLRYPGNWMVEASDDDTSTLLLRVEPEIPGMETGDVASLLIRIESRSSHEAALNRLRDIASQYDTPGEYLEIGGWPAYQRVHSTRLEKIGQVDRDAGRIPMVERVTIALAAGSQVIRFEGKAFAAQSPAVDEIQQMGRSLLLAVPGDAATARLELEDLRAQPRRIPVRPPRDDGKPMIGAAGLDPLDFGQAQQSQTGLVRNLANGSEIEVVVSPDGRDIIVATNGRRYSVSNDGGLTFAQDEINTPDLAGADDVAYNANGDPSLAYGQGGDFYFGFIAYPDGAGGAGNTQAGCTTAITASTNGGQTFSHRGHARFCPLNDPDGDGPGKTCFPDQEHIAADRWNPSATGMDQVYSAWRDFTPGGQNVSCNNFGSGSVQSKLVCSSDDGATFGSTRNLNGDFPRVTVGQNGFVYVVTQVGETIEIAKFSSCQNGLSLQADFPATVATGVSAVTCPVPGLDRCNDGNDLRSATAAVDDEDASHVFVVWAENTGGGNENVYIKDSTNGGKDWSSAVALNSGFAARRYMPWVCSVGGTAYAGWFDRRASGAVDNSLTDFFGGSAERTASGFTAGTEFRISPTSDSNCGSGWPCAPRSTADSESCTQQPQLAGVCVDDDPDTADSRIRCDFSDGGCPDSTTSPSGNDESCKGGGGCPKYGDYNGIACAAGRIYMAYASATPAGGPQGTDVDSYLLQNVVCCVPQIQVPAAVSFGEVCVGETALDSMEICNTGEENLEVASIASSSAQFAVTEPSSGFPVVISPDFCFPFEVSFTPTSMGAKAATLTVTNNDPVNPSVVVDATGMGAVPNISTIMADSGDFGDVCEGAFKDLDLTIQNSGDCDLSITNITSSSSQFKTANVMSYPLVIAPGGSLAVPIRFEPTSAGAKSGNITVSSNDPDQPSTVVSVSGDAPTGDISTAIADSGNYGNVCIGEFKDLDLTIANNGGCDLSVSGIVSNSPEFVTAGVMNYPLVIGPGDSLAVALRFQPISLGAKAAGFTVSSDDPDTPSQLVPVSGNVPPGDIRFTGSTDFGDVCAEELAEKTVNICNVGLCNLAVSEASVDCDDFTLVNNPFPATVSPDSCLDLVIRFTPTSAGPKTCTLTVVSDDPDMPSVTRELTANTPFASIDVPPDLAFAPTVLQEIDACSSAEPFPVSNTGQCNLRITDFAVSTNPEEYSLSGLPSFPIILQPGHIVGEGDLRSVFEPLVLDRNRLGALSVTYVDDPILGTTLTESRNLCGEGVYTGARVLVTQAGVPLTEVDQIRINRVNANSNKNRVDTVDTSNNLVLETVTPSAPCPPFQYHKEYGTVSNPIQLLPGSYQVTVRTRINGKMKNKTVAFDVTSCGFNPTIVVNF